MELDGIFLDMYGTLTAGDREAVEVVCRDVVRDTGVAISAHELAIKWGEQFFHALDFRNGDGFKTLFEIEQETLKDTMASLDMDIDPLPYAEALKRYWRNAPLQPEVKRFLAEFRYPICIVSSADREDLDNLVAREGLSFDHIVTSEDAKSYKPDRRIFEVALERTGWRPERVIHVGDSLHSDVGGAIAAGIRSGWVNRAHRMHDIGNHEPDHEFEDLMGLVRLLQRQ